MFAKELPGLVIEGVAFENGVVGTGNSFLGNGEVRQLALAFAPCVFPFFAGWVDGVGELWKESPVLGLLFSSVLPEVKPTSD